MAKGLIDSLGTAILEIGLVDGVAEDEHVIDTDSDE